VGDVADSPDRTSLSGLITAVSALQQNLLGHGLMEPEPERKVEVWSHGSAGPVATIRFCGHGNAVPVTLKLTGETVARLCPDCGEQIRVAGW